MLETAQEREKRLWAEAIRNGAASPGMVNQSATDPKLAAAMQQAATSTAAQKQAIAAQQQYAQQLRGTAMPEGRQAGDIYQAANPLEFLGALGNQGVGAMMARKIREESIPALDEAEQRQRMGELQIADMYQQQNREDKGLDRAISQQNADTSAGQLQATIENNQATQRLNRAKLARDWAATEPMEAVDTTDQGRPPLFAIMTPDRGLVDAQSGTPMPEGYQLRDDPNARASSGQAKGSLSVNKPERYVDDEGNVRWLGARKDGVFVDVDAQEALTPGELETLRRETGLRQEDPINANQMNKQITDYQKAKAGGESMKTDIKMAEDTWKKYGWKPESGESPFNWFTKQDGVLGGAVRLAEDAVSEGAPAGDSYAAARTVMNNITRQRAGLSQTITEVANIKAETGMDVLSDPQVFMQYWGRIKAAIDADQARIDATLSPTVRKEIQAREASAKGSDEGEKPPGMPQEKWDRLQELKRKQANGAN